MRDVCVCIFACCHGYVGVGLGRTAFRRAPGREPCPAGQAFNTVPVQGCDAQEGSWTTSVSSAACAFVAPSLRVRAYFGDGWVVGGWMSWDAIQPSPSAADGPGVDPSFPLARVCLPQP